MSLLRIALAVLLVAVGLSGCTRVDQRASGGSQQSSDQPSVAPEAGIGIDEAKRESVNVGLFDAIATPRGESNGRRTFVLRNVGSEPDRYTIVAEGPQAVVAPKSAELLPGEEVSVTVNFPQDAADQVELVVNSAGRRAEVIRIPVSWRG